MTLVFREVVMWLGQEVKTAKASGRRRGGAGWGSPRDNDQKRVLCLHPEEGADDLQEGYS